MMLFIPCHVYELRRSAVVYAEVEGSINSSLCGILTAKLHPFMVNYVEAHEIAGCVWYQYQPRNPIQEHHHTATVAKDLLATKEV